jgi:DNA-binding NarL/FixJ family response regulator
MNVGFRVAAPNLQYGDDVIYLSNAMIHLLLVDDQNLIRRGLKALLKPEPELTVLGEAGNGREALDWLRSATQLPDVILMDVRMPEMDGVAATGAIVTEFPTVKILILTTFDDTEYVAQALQNGASGYLLKDTPAEELVQAIQLVQKGYTQLAPGLAQKLILGTPAAELSIDPLLAELTPREQEILQLIAQGASNREIAQQLYIAEKTVKNHITSLLSRLGLRDRTQAAVWLHRQRGEAR